MYSATTCLLAELAQWSTLDISQVTDGDNHWVVGIEVFGIELMLIGDNLCTTGISILHLHFHQLVLHHLLATLGIVENFL